MRYPDTKQEANALESENVSWGAEPTLGKLLYNYLIDLGVKHDLPKDKVELVKYINRFHKKLTVDNVHFPNDISFSIIYPSFLSAVVNGHIELSEYQPHSAKSQLSAFKKWITKGGQLDKLYQQHYHKHPKKQPKRITQGNIGGVESWADSDILDQYKKIKLVMGEKIPILNTIGAQSYFDKIFEEANKRGLIQ